MNTITIQKATSRGQVTLPAAWRKQFNTNSYVVKTKKDEVAFKPIDLEKLTDETVVFDADRDNNGKPLTGEELLRILDSIDGRKRKTV